LRHSFASRFVVLALPRFLVRRKYDARRFLGRRADSLASEEVSSYTEHYSSAVDNRLWANAAFAVAQVVLRSFADSGWLADIHGLPIDGPRAGVVPQPVRDEFHLDEHGLYPSIATEIVVTDDLEKELAALGFLALCDRQPVPCTFIGSAPSIHLPSEGGDESTEISERISSMLHYMLCASRFAHYIKRIGHDHVGGTGNYEDYQRVLREFLFEYVLTDENAKPELKAKQPLNDASVRVFPVPGRPGEYRCEIMLKPHYDLDAIEVRLETELGRLAS
jgi:type VI secretion system protein ImpD